MQIVLKGSLPSGEIAQKLLFSSSDPIGKSGIADWEHTAAAVFPGGSFHSDLTVARRLAYLDGRPSKLVGQELLRRENSFSPLTSEQRINLEAAGSDRAVYLITGQQPGLFGGPMLWYFKALTAVTLARQWTAKLSRPVIPIFWVAGDDSDLQECNHVDLLDARAKEVVGSLALPFPNSNRPIPVGERQVDPDALAALLARLSPIWNSDTVDTLRRCYPVPSTLSSGFLRLAQLLLGKEGILFIDGYSKHVRELSRPILEQAIEHFDGYHEALTKGTNTTEAAGIKTQVGLRPGLIHAFALIQGERHRLYAEHASDGSLRVYTQESPSHNLYPTLSDLELTHDVFTRPLVVDAALPVLGHILGPAELRYFSQMSSLFIEVTGDMPLLQPRMSAIVAPQEAWDDFNKNGLDLPEVVRMKASGLRSWLQEKQWRSHPIASMLSSSQGERWVEELRHLHGSHFNDRGSLDRFEKSVGHAWMRYLRSLERASFDERATDYQSLFAHLQWLGGGQGQDRHLNYPSLFNVLGKEGFAALRAALSPTNTEQQFLFFSRSDK